MSKKIGSRSLAVYCLAVVGIAGLLYFGVDRSRADDEAVKFSDTNPWAPKPAGTLLKDASTGEVAVMPLTMTFARTPDKGGPDSRGRFLLAVNSGYGLQINSKSKAQQTISVIDLALKPEPMVVQTLYFPAPQSANVGITFDPKVRPDGTYQLYVSGGVENKVWILQFDPKVQLPLAHYNKPDTPFEAPFLDVTPFAENAPSPNYNDKLAAVYPTGIGISPDGQTLYTANNLADSLGIISDIRDARKVQRIDLHRPGSTQMLYPYEIAVKAARDRVSKVYVSFWGDGAIAVV